MFAAPKAVLIGIAITASTLTVAAPADAAGLRYDNCTRLAKDYKHGVAKSRTAAMKQVRAGYGRPAYGDRARRVYWANESRLDRDSDGTACER